MTSQQTQWTTEEVFALLWAMAYPKETLEELQSLSVCTYQDAICTFADRCTHNQCPCRGKLYYLEGGGYACEGYLDQYEQDADGVYMEDRCVICGDRPAFKLASTEPVKDHQEYTALVEQEVPFEKYSKEAVDFFKTYIVPLYFTHQYKEIAVEISKLID